MSPKPDCQCTTFFARFKERLEPIYKLPSGADYHTHEQITSHLNDVLGPDGWSFRVLEHGVEAAGDECWALVELSATMWGHSPNDEGYVQTTVVKQAFGAQSIKRSRSTGDPLSIGDDRKGAASDGLKKAASLLGIGLYLWEKEAPYRRPEDQPIGRPKPSTPGDRVTPPGNAQNGSGTAPTPISGRGGSSTGQTSTDLDILYCEECGEPLTETRFKDGTNWSPDQLAVFGRRKHSRILCMRCYREANNAKRRAEEALQQVPF